MEFCVHVLLVDVNIMNKCTSKWYYNAVLVYGAIYRLHSVQKSRMSGLSQRECMAFVINQLHVRHCTCITSYDDSVSKSMRRFRFWWWLLFLPGVCWMLKTTIILGTCGCQSSRCIFPADEARNSTVQGSPCLL